MRDAPPDRLRLTVLGCSTAAPHPTTPTAGYLVEWGTTALLLDVGQGVIRALQRVLDPHDLSAIVIGHMHADHYLDVVGLRYLFPWGEPSPEPLPIHLPPGGRARFDALATAITERVGFFDAAFDAREYDPDAIVEVGPLRLRFVRGRHYVPAWGVVVEAPDGDAARLHRRHRSVGVGRRGDARRRPAARRGGAAGPRHDDPERGHLTPEEAIDMATASGRRSRPARPLRAGRRAELEAPGGAAPGRIAVAIAGLTVTVGRPARRRDAREPDALADRQDRARLGVRGPDAHPRGDDLGDLRSAPAPPGPARAGRPPGRRRRRPGGP